MIQLSELNAEIRGTSWGDEHADALWFDCPLNCDPKYGHRHVIPFEFGKSQHGKRPQIGNVWGHVSGDTIENITLAPSYLSETAGKVKRCRLHIFVRNGNVQVLSDSRCAS